MLKKRKTTNKTKTNFNGLKRVLNWGFHSLAIVSLLTEGYVIYSISHNPTKKNAVPDTNQTAPLKMTTTPTTLTSEQLKILQIVAEMIRTHPEAAHILNQYLNTSAPEKKPFVPIQNTPVFNTTQPFKPTRVQSAKILYQKTGFSREYC